MKWKILCAVFVAFFALLSTNVLAGIFPVTSVSTCAPAPDHTASNFCSGFKATVYCNCKSQNQPIAICSSVKLVYRLMKIKYQLPAYCQNSADWLECACTANDPGNVQECEDQWDCYMTGNPENTADGDCYGKNGPVPNSPC
ncbi:MAG TPA: hypothetical protein VJK30_01520 [Coxiellaceae bacterium]|nr:MAG: hypothetical protein A3E81_04425 [Gammaproteobacteria bacterium RIFCSPHIGHO2_12_FULL_36_30]HLB55998.1 hypothetical protein [Coxiellaceae bacterium]